MHAGAAWGEDRLTPPTSRPKSNRTTDALGNGLLIHARRRFFPLTYRDDGASKVASCVIGGSAAPKAHPPLAMYAQ